RPEPVLLLGDHSNTLVAYGHQLLLKVFRSVEEGIHPEVEVGRTLSQKTAFSHTAPVAGGFEYRPSQGQPLTGAALLGYVPHEGDAWHYTLDTLRRYFVQVLTQHDPGQDPVLPSQTFFELAAAELPPLAGELIGSYLELARLMGQRTAELHLAFGSI